MRRPFRLVVFLCVLYPAVAPAAPFIPNDDQQILERLPIRPADPVTRELREARRRLIAAPANPALAADLATRYFRLAQRDGDPRYIGYAQSVLTPWADQTEAPSEILVARALLAQFVHDFAGAERDLGRVIEREPGHLAARSYRAILNLVQSKFDAALADCAALAASARGLVIAACEPTVRAVTGDAASAYRELSNALANSPEAPANERFWVRTRLAEIAARRGDRQAAEMHFKAALAMNISDQYLLATYAEFLLDAGRAGEVVELLRELTRNDVLLLRLALAEKAVGTPALKAHVDLIAARIDAARRRGDELHLSDEATFELVFRNHPVKAARLARRNWDSGQREPSDLRLLLETALAARHRAIAEPALEWMRSTQHEDARLKDLAARVASLP